VSEGFADQALGLSRTAIEAFFSLRYIENDKNKSEERAKRYLEYFGKDREHLMAAISRHHPELANNRPPDYEQLMRMAKTFKSPHKWYPENTLKEVACEKSTWVFDDSGRPQDCEYTYDIVYKFASHEVHATSVALEMRIADLLHYSNYPSAFTFSKKTQNSKGDNAIVNACIHCQAAVEHLCHAFGIAVPPRVQEQFEEWQKAIGIGKSTTQL
jgi:hypothetical protein